MSSKQKFREVVDDGVSLLEQTADRPGRRIRAIGAVADVVNRNGRRYSSSVLREAVERAQAKLSRSLGHGNALLGEADHPQDNRPRVLLTVVKWEDIQFNETTRQIELEGRLIESSAGRDLLALMDAELYPGVSLRGYGTSDRVDGDDGALVEEVTWLELTGFDLVFEQSFPEAAVTVLEQSEEKNQDKIEEGESNMEKNAQDPVAEQAAAVPPVQDTELARKMTETMEKAQAAEKAQADAEKALAEATAREAKLAEEKAALEAVRAELEKAQREREIAEAITEATAKLPYTQAINGRLTEAVKAAQPQTAEAVAALVEAKRAEYDAIVAAARVTAQGGIAVLGPVFERETGQPEFALPAYQLQEQMVARGRAAKRNLAQDATRGGLMARQMLESFDKAYRTQLIQESNDLRQWQEAESTTDLNLPYSVMRTIIPEVYAELVAANVFDVATIENSPARLYFENYAAESGAAPAIVDEVVTAALGGWVALANKRIRPGTVVLTNSGATVTYVENTDYVVDYANGRLYALTGGAITNSQSLKIDYTYEKVRGGEGAGIQRGKGQLSFQTIETAADRLAALVNDEAMTFARTQLGWDAMTRTMAMLTREIREYIDQGMIRLAVANAIVSGNSGGSWTASGADYGDLVEKLGTAKVAVENDFYMPAYFLMSKTNADRLSNWTGLTRDGFPDAVLGAAGFANMQIKGLPVFSSVHMPDSVIVVGHPELVQHRVLASKPLHLEGPFQGYSSGNVTAAKEWYAEEYNATVSLIPNKGGFVKVA